jgi:hypothetical protein
MIKDERWKIEDGKWKMIDDGILDLIICILVLFSI